MSIEFLITSLIAVSSVIASALLTPYTSFKFTARSNKLEKNLALRASLRENESNRELDYLIKKQTNKYVSKNLRKEIKPSLDVQILIFLANLTAIILFLFCIRAIFFPVEIKTNIFFSTDTNLKIPNNAIFWVALFTFTIGIRILVGSIAKKTDFGSSYYGARLFQEDKVVKEIVGTSYSNWIDDVIYKVPKFSLSDDNEPTAIISHEEIYVSIPGMDTYWVFEKIPNSSGTGIITSTLLFGLSPRLNNISIFDYSFSKKITATEFRTKKERVYAVNLITFMEKDPKETILSKIRDSYLGKEKATFFFKGNKPLNCTGYESNKGSTYYWRILDKEEYYINKKNEVKTRPILCTSDQIIYNKINQI